MTKSAKLRRRVGVFVYNDKGQVFAEESPYRDTLRFLAVELITTTL